MTPFGLKKIEQAKADGSWYFSDDVQENRIPDDLLTALAAKPIAKRHFEAVFRSIPAILKEDHFGMD